MAAAEDLLVCAAPAGGQKLRLLVGRLTESFGKIQRQPAAILHGDLHLKNFFATDGRVALIDWDNVCAGDPLQEMLREQRDLRDPGRPTGDEIGDDHLLLLALLAEVDLDREHRRRWAVLGQPLAWGADEEVEQGRLGGRRGVEQVTARPGPGEQRLGDPRHEHRGDGGVDGVPALAQHPGPRLGGQRMPRRHHARITAHRRDHPAWSEITSSTTGPVEQAGRPDAIIVVPGKDAAG